MYNVKENCATTNLLTAKYLRFQELILILTEHDLLVEDRIGLQVSTFPVGHLN